MLTLLPWFAILVGLLVAWPMTWYLIKLGRRSDLLDSSGSGGHQKALRSIPNIGGLALFCGAVGPLFIGVFCALLSKFDNPQNLLGSIFVDIPEQVIGRSFGVWLAIIGSTLVLHVVGLVDDRRALGARLKLLVQILLAGMLVIFMDVRLLHVLDDFVPGGWFLSCVLSIGWLVVITNAFNFLDNMDGLSAGVAAIVASILMIATILNGQWFIAISLGFLIGALIGFLRFNFPPAKIFMGDGGSLVIGWLLAIATIRTTFVDTADPNYALGTAWYGALMPLFVMAVPLYDFTSVMVIRCLQGHSPFVGDQQHFSHRLVKQGLASRRAVLVIWGITLAIGLNGIVLGSVSPFMAVCLALATLALLGVIALLETGLPSRIESQNV
jgi:UDP-GlcNAc:undecaprenyl-phosphate GlcNAc-1-phosphate transferase